MTTTATQPHDPQESRQKRGAPLGNANAFRYGMRGSGLPKGCWHIQEATCHFRRELESAVLEARQEITLVDAAVINTAFRCERHAQLGGLRFRLSAKPVEHGEVQRDVPRRHEKIRARKRT